jgi:hypothetical protein
MDPFTETLERLWYVLETHSELNSLVKVGNRIKLHESKTQPWKSATAHADYPELSIEPASFSGHFNVTNTSHALQQEYVITITGRTLAVNETFFPVKWAVYKALANAKMPSFVIKMAVSGGQDSIVQETSGGGHKWSATLNILVDMFFTKTSTN